MNKLVDLLNYGQSYWLDNLTRKKITSGELTNRVSEYGLRGITSNPSIFHDAITGSTDYNDQIKELVEKDFAPRQIYDSLTIKDVQDACDILKPVFDSSGGTDGFVSLEVSPYLARDTQGSVTEARKLYKMVNRLNCYIKIPGTKEGVPAIEQLLYEGININITLLFSIESYVAVAHAYIRALQRRHTEGKPIYNIVSVASLFVSRIDVLVDKLLSEYIISGSEADVPKPQLLFGKAAIASAKMAYQHYKNIFRGPDWENLKSNGAKVQRLLWASTSTKDPIYRDVRYVEALIGMDTVNTIPDKTIDAFAAHGILKKDAIEEDVNKWSQIFNGLKKMGIDIDDVTWQLENDGIRKFIEPFDKLMASLAEKRTKILEGRISTQVISCGSLKKEIETACTALDEKQVGRRLYEKDPYLWKTEASQAKMIAENMGWITLPDDFTKMTKPIKEFASEIAKEGYKYVVLLGMGGSSLCSEVARETFDTVENYPHLLVLDNTDPSAIKDIEKRIDIEKTLFIVASKSGSTEETISFFRYFYQVLEQKAEGVMAGKNFVAITDAESPLVKTASEYKFRKTFINPPGIGGRYSVLSDFGLLPMALMGVDIDGLMTRAKNMNITCNGDIPAANNPAISLGLVLGICQRHGLDKVTFVLSRSINSFGYWVEQLLAESTGKEGKALIPVNGEKLGDPDIYENDRVFVHISLKTDDNSYEEEKLKALETVGHPIVRIKLNDKLDLGGEYFRWELAVAVAGVIMGINPFDQPNVEESKKNTKDLLENWKLEGSFKKNDPQLKVGTLSIYYGSEVKNITNQESSSIIEFLNQFESLTRPGNYIALLPYFLMTDHLAKVLQNWRMQIKDHLKKATTLLSGPRYLHSTGQMHKGGPDSGLYFILIGDETEPLPIPGQKFGFETLHQAQALGDFRSLDEKGRRVVLVRLGKNIDESLGILYQSAIEANKQYAYHEAV